MWIRRESRSAGHGSFDLVDLITVHNNVILVRGSGTDKGSPFRHNHDATKSGQREGTSNKKQFPFPSCRSTFVPMMQTANLRRCDDAP